MHKTGMNWGSLGRIMRILGELGAMTLLGAMSTTSAYAVDITLLHTNDLHSHFRAEKTDLGLGGVARIKTAVDRVRAEAPNTLFVDGGDWSEGSIYFTPGGGTDTLRMMDHLGYDVALVGNHDWFNGPDHLLDILAQVAPRFAIIGSNIKTTRYARENEFRRRIPPYVIREVGGVRVAFIGLMTYEFVYDHYLAPIQVTEPFLRTRELAKQLRKQADIVVAISHNQTFTNKEILKIAPEIDFIVGAHDHQKYFQPIQVERSGGRPGWIVETGCWGRYVGRMDLNFENGVVKLAHYQLIQMDSRIPEDPDTLARVARLEGEIEAERGPVFHDHVGDTHVDLNRQGLESLMGDFVTDAYRQATGADISIDHSNFIYGELRRGPISTADVFNSNPGVFSFASGKAWTLHLVPIQGNRLRWLLSLLYSFKKFGQVGSLNFSGSELILDPRSAMGAVPIPGPLTPLITPPANTMSLSKAVKSFKIDGKDLVDDSIYRLAAPGGVYETLEFVNSLIPRAIPLDQAVDTGIEDWRILKDAVARRSPIRLEDLDFGLRIRTVQPDLGFTEDDLSFAPTRQQNDGSLEGTISLRVRNSGIVDSPAGPQVQLLANRFGTDYTRDRDDYEVALAQAVPALAPGASALLIWPSVRIPGASQGLHPLTARLVGAEMQANFSNDEATRYFK